MNDSVCAVVGVGPGNGAAFARHFAKEGHAVALLARQSDTIGALATELPRARAYSCDVTAPGDIEDSFGAIASELGPIETLVYNAGSGMWGNIEEISAEQLENSWQINTRGLFQATRQVLPAMVEAGRGNIVVIGATASLRGGANFAAFASAKAAQRSLAQSMARHLGPKGIHVSLVIIDGVVDIPRTREMFPDRADDSFLKPEHIADTVYQLTRQPASAWTFEVDLRPATENW